MNFFYSPPPSTFSFFFSSTRIYPDTFFMFLFFAKIVGNNPSLVPRNIGANLWYLCFICIPAFHESPSWLCWGWGPAKTLNKYESHCCLMLVQVFLASAERGGMEEVGQVCGPEQNTGEKPVIRLSHTTETCCPFPPPQPFWEIRQRGRWKTAGPFSGYLTRSDIPQFSLVTVSPSGQNCENVHGNTASGVLKDSRPFRFCYIFL